MKNSVTISVQSEPRRFCQALCKFEHRSPAFSSLSSSGGEGWGEDSSSEISVACSWEASFRFCARIGATNLIEDEDEKEDEDDWKNGSWETLKCLRRALEHHHEACFPGYPVTPLWVSVSLESRSMRSMESHAKSIDE